MPVIGSILTIPFIRSVRPHVGALSIQHCAWHVPFHLRIGCAAVCHTAHLNVPVAGNRPIRYKSTSTCLRQLFVDNALVRRYIVERVCIVRHAIVRAHALRPFRWRCRSQHRAETTLGAGRFGFCTFAPMSRTLSKIKSLLGCLNLHTTKKEKMMFGGANSRLE